MADGLRFSLLIPLSALLIAGVVIDLVLYWFVICRTLYKFGAKFPTGIAFWRIPRELKAFRDICSTRGKSFTPYAAFLILFGFNFLMAIVLVLRLLWERTSPPS
jgi:hypothetical protein